MNNTTNPMTPFDQYLTDPSLQMTKLLIPFLPSKTQRLMAVYVKFLELKQTLSFFQGIHLQSNNPEDILDHIKPYMSRSDAEAFDNVLQMMNMMSMMQDIDPAAMMNGMFEKDNDTELQKEGETHD